MPKILSQHELEKRKTDSNYFQNGKPKKQAMMCRDKQYLAEVRRINGYFVNDYICAGNRCPLYRTGCDDAGREW